MILFGMIEIKWPGEIHYQVEQLILDDRIIPAIKLYRDYKKCSLLKAKIYVDKVRVELQGKGEDAINHINVKI